MKKFISLLAAVSLFSTMLVANVSAAYADVATVTSTANEITVAEYNAATEQTLDDTKYDAYKVSVELGNIGTVNSVVTGSGSRAKFSGRQIVTVNYKATFDDTSAMDITDYALGQDSVMYSAFGATDAQKWDGKTYVAAPMSPFPGANNVEYTDKVSDALIFYYAIEKGKTANATVVAEIGLQNYSSSAPAAGEEVEKHSDAETPVNITANGFTIGKAAPTVKLSKVEITSTATEVVDGQTLALTAKAVNNDNSENKTATLAWTSSKEDVATVEGGVVKALKPGKTTISVTATDGTTTTPADEVEITVTKATPFVKSIGITGETTVEEGQTLTLTAVTKDQYDDPITVDVEWKSSDEDVATVVDGVVTAKTAGKTTITANVKGMESFKSEKEITVTAKPVVNPEITINGATGFVDGVAVDTGAVKGFVWTPVVISNYNSKAGTYTATFKADGVTPDKTAALNGMPAIEGNPTVTFAVILRTNKTGVKLGIDFAE